LIKTESLKECQQTVRQSRKIKIKTKEKNIKCHSLDPEVVLSQSGVVDAQHDGTSGDDGVLDLKTQSKVMIV